MNLQELAKNYLKSQGYDIIRESSDFFHASREALGQESDDYLVWVPRLRDAVSYDSQLRPYLTQFQEAAEDYPSAKRQMLLPRMEGVPSYFRSRAREHGIGIRVPIQFFDTPFRGEGSRTGSPLSVGATLRNRGMEASRRRIPQPFKVRKGSEEGREGADLREQLFNGLVMSCSDADRSTASVNIVVAPAGFGKSVLFDALFGDLYSYFQDMKRKRVQFPRPLPLVLEHLTTSTAPNLRSLIHGSLRTDFAPRVEYSGYKWLMTNGFAIWMLDGLDEIIARDPEFFSEVWELLTDPKTSIPPVILICVRDSLLVTNDNFKDFCEEQDSAITIYDLAPWQRASKEEFSRRKFGLEHDASKFMNILRSQPQLDELASTPYYCDLITDEYGSGHIRFKYTETELMDIALERIIEREYSKDLLDRIALPIPKALEYLQEVALDNFDNGYNGVSPEDLVEYAEVVALESGVEGDGDRLRLSTGLGQIAVFTEGTTGDNIYFAQEVLAHHLLGRALYEKLETETTDRLVRALSVQPIQSDNIAIRTVANRLRYKRTLSKLMDIPAKQRLNDVAWRNLVQIAIYASDDSKLINPLHNAQDIERRDLSNMVLENLDLENVSFRNCNLSGVVFRNCDMRGAKFEGAIINETEFGLREQKGLTDASFGDMNRIHSLRTERGRMLTDVKSISRWIHDRTGAEIELPEPCAYAKQLRVLFGKFVDPNGKARRAMIVKRSALSGKRFADPERTLNVAIANSYVHEEAARFRDRIKRGDGDKYREMVDYTKDLAMTLGIRRVLNRLCADTRCPHVPSPNGDRRRA